MKDQDKKFESEPIVEKGVRLAGTKLVFTEDSVPSFFIEGLVGGAITQIYQQLTYVSEISKNKNHERHSDLIKETQALCIIAFQESQQVVDLLKDMKDATLSPRHKAFRKITKTFIERLKEKEDAFMKAETVGDRAVISSVKDIMDWLTTATEMLDSRVKVKDIKKHIMAYNSMVH